MTPGDFVSRLASSVFGLLQKKADTAAASYRDLLNSIIEKGKQPSAEAVVEQLVTWGISPRQFNEDLARMARRKELKLKIAELKPDADRIEPLHEALAKLKSEERKSSEKAEAAKRQAQEKYEADARPLKSQLASAQQAQQDLVAAESELARHAPPELNSKVEEAREEVMLATRRVEQERNAGSVGLDGISREILRVQSELEKLVGGRNAPAGWTLAIATKAKATQLELENLVAQRDQMLADVAAAEQRAREDAGVAAAREKLATRERELLTA